MRHFIFLLLIGLLSVFSVIACTDDDDDNNDDNNPPTLIVPYSTVPDWESSDIHSISTGLGIADINHDAIPDVIVANGNDIEQQNIVVY